MIGCFHCSNSLLSSMNYIRAYIFNSCEGLDSTLVPETLHIFLDLQK